MHIVGPHATAAAPCEAVLRSLPEWFGIEEALVEYARSTERLPTFVASEDEAIVGFVSLEQHFESAWEVHCMAVHRAHRNRGLGRALLMHVEEWLVRQGAAVLQVKTIAATSSNESYAQTREFYARTGFVPLEVFPDLWSPRHPCLQLIKFLPHTP